MQKKCNGGYGMAKKNRMKLLTKRMHPEINKK
jgi:hypothetical protein